MPDPDEVAHPKPTLATVRELYSHAFTCAQPECAEWLYRQESGVARPVLNSRVSHIHARQPGGPRWKPGMSSEDNRSVKNLLLMCIPHSYEIDEHEARFSPELLQEWRVGQIQEYFDRRHGWPIDEDEAVEVLAASFDSPPIAAPVLRSVVEAAELYALRALGTRSGPAAAAAAWRRTRAEANAMVLAYDDDGNRVFVEPSNMERQQHERAVLAALDGVRAVVGPLYEDVLAKVATARHTSLRSGPWCDWVARAVDELLAAASTWPWVPPYEDTDRLSEAAAEVRAAVSGLASSLRGENPPAPPTVPEPVASKEDETRAALAEAMASHNALLERARPWARVKTKAYDPDLRAELVVAADEVTLIPQVWSTYGFALGSVASLAASVARNATGEEVAALISEDRARRPLVVAAALLVELWQEMIAAERGDLANLARESLLEELAAQDWSAENAWVGNYVHGAKIFTAWSHWASADAVKGALSGALDAAPARLDDVVLTCASWLERESRVDGSRHAARSYRELPHWFPTEALVRAAAVQYPHVVATTSDYDDGVPEGTPEVEHHLSHILRLATGPTAQTGDG
ncbi:hypothetical protein [Microbacterium sp. zg-YB36]|uniref:hypothetical protein n=1 Tax=Microbacterium sp. zg-YB36 TaxID=2969407 RepID=UPI00214BEEC2|nr:hypothetical protein [Microbacterium sp. zg-YB36]MDL5351058.1 hypothetical protein [Microbacterium sp. zg-YB36]